VVVHCERASLCCARVVVDTPARGRSTSSLETAMRRAAEEKTRTLNVWRRHLRMHGATLACVCEFQAGRFRKGQRIGGCGNSRCWLCHSAKLLGEPTLQQRRNATSYVEGLADAALQSNNRWSARAG
jgi:hypothetical protein